MSGPLNGVRVLDLTSMISGPVATMLLADQGAQVIKVEPPTGDLVRAMGPNRGGFTAAFISSNRGKQSIALDLKNPEGCEVLRRLIPTADVFIQNFRPGAIERMGFGEEAVRELAPEIVYTSISGFGENGPYAHKRVYDPVIQALSGLAAIQADGPRPRMVRTIIPDKTTALAASQAITAALFCRERTGRGQHVKLAMLDTMVAYLWPEGMAGYTLMGREVKAARAQFAQDLIFATQDGFITAGAVSDSEWQGMCKALNREQWLSDERFNTPTGRIINVKERLEMTQEVLATDTSDHWLTLLDAHGVPCAPVLSREEVFNHEQILVNEMIEEFDHPGAGRVRQPRPAARFSATPAKIAGPAPALGEHSESLLVTLGYTKAEVEKLVENKVVIRQSNSPDGD